MTTVKGAFGDLKGRVGDSFKKLVVTEVIEFLKKDSTVDKICHFVIDNDPSKELYDYVELRKQDNENAEQMFEMLVYRWADLIEYLNTEEGREKLLRLLRNINKWIAAVNLAEQQYQQQYQQQLQQQQQQPNASDRIKGRPAKTEKEEEKESEKKSEEREPPP